MCYWLFKRKAMETENSHTHINLLCQLAWVGNSELTPTTSFVITFTFHFKSFERSAFSSTLFKKNGKKIPSFFFLSFGFFFSP